MRAFPLLAAALLLASSVPLHSQEELVPQPGRDAMGHAVVVVPQRTDAGSWDGTWVYAK